MSKIKFLLFSYFIILFIGCSSKQDYYTILSEKVLNNIDENLDLYDMIVFIPGSGCDGCITYAENFFKDNVSNQRVKFIFTFVASKKNLGLKVGKDNLTHPNVLIDNDNEFYLRQYDERHYPYILYITNGAISGITMLDALY